MKFHTSDNAIIPEKRIILLSIIFLLAVSLVGNFSSASNAESEKTTTVILIRHVERDNFFNVTARGHERARALVKAVGDMKISTIYSPDLERNLDTVRPLSKHLGISITIIPRISKKSVDRIVSQILIVHPGEVVLLVGNGAGNLRALHHRLGGTGEGPYTYGDMFTYRIPDEGPVKVIKSKFGS